MITLKPHRCFRGRTLNLGTDRKCQLNAPATLHPGKERQLPIDHEALQASEPVAWKLERRVKSLVPVRDVTDSSIVQSVGKSLYGMSY
jgi:hypothetical protein